MSKWFANFEDIAYSVVEYVPYVGTLYSLERARVAYRAGDWVRHWQSVGNLLESAVRDVIIFNEIAEPVPVAILHTMAESFTDKMIEIYHQEPTAEEPKRKFKITKTLDKKKGHVIIAGTERGSSETATNVFRGIAKGMHLFHGAVFTGTLTHTKYAQGEKIGLYIPQGLYDGAPVTFSWKWTTNYKGYHNVPEATFGRIILTAGTPTRFELSSSPKGSAGCEGYNFRGQVDSVNKIKATTTIGGIETEIDFNRVAGT